MIRQKTTTKLIMLSVSLMLSSCAVENFSQNQIFCNFSRDAQAACSDNSSGIAHHSGKVHAILGLISWGDASLQSAENIAGDGSIKLSRVSIIDEQRKFLFGTGCYYIIIYGYSH